MAVILIVYFLRRTSGHRSALPWLVALILGGAIGNIIDRVFYGVWFEGINSYHGNLLEGRVVDMFFLDLGTFHLFGMQLELWPVFNIADASILSGILCILFFQGHFLKTHRRNLVRDGLDPELDPIIIRQEGKKKMPADTASADTTVIPPPVSEEDKVASGS
jgi:signal peptidase II